MKTIWKIGLEIISNQEIMVPDGAEFLCAREQHGNVCIWFRCDPLAKKIPRQIAIVGTGHDAPDGRYIGTASLHGGNLILHVFEV